MSKVQVYNLNSHVYKEHFRGKDIVIKPDDYVEMEQDEAILFKGTMNKVKVDADGNPLPETYKMIRIVSGDREKKEIQDDLMNKINLKCQACGYEAVSNKDLELHSQEEHAGIQIKKK